jgi:hypothetical protein
MIDATTLDALAEFPRRLEAHYAAIPARFANWTPPSWDGIPSEPFTALEQICHVRDIESDGYHVRFVRTLRETNPNLPDVDGTALARERAYANARADEVFAAFRLARSHSLTQISTWDEDQLARPALFEGRPATLAGLVHTLCSHDQQHLAGLQWLLARISTAR